MALPQSELEAPAKPKKKWFGLFGNSDPSPDPQPVAAEPVVAQPMAAEPVVAQPVAAEPVVAQPVAAEPVVAQPVACLLYTSPSPRDLSTSRMPSSA